MTVAPSMKQAVAPRHDIERVARMQQAYRARQLDLACRNDEALAAHAAQIGELVARAEPAAIDDVSVRPLAPVQAVAKRHVDARHAGRIQEKAWPPAGATCASPA